MPPPIVAAASNSGLEPPVRGSVAARCASFADVPLLPDAPLDDGAVDTGAGGLLATVVGPHAMLANEAVRGASGLSVRVVVKSGVSARFRAFASRCVSGASPHRHSIIFNTELCSYGPSWWIFAADHGDTTMHGT